MLENQVDHKGVPAPKMLFGWLGVAEVEGWAFAPGFRGLEAFCVVCAPNMEFSSGLLKILIVVG